MPNVICCVKNGSGAGVFAQLGFADNERNQIASYLGFGITYTDLWARRSEDVAGVTVAHARNSAEFNMLNPDLARAETALELSYQFAATRWLILQPDVQYIINPGTNPAIDNTLVASVRVQIAF